VKQVLADLVYFANSFTKLLLNLSTVTRLAAPAVGPTLAQNPFVALWSLVQKHSTTIYLTPDPDDQIVGNSGR
jgi:hypothetical protein